MQKQIEELLDEIEGMNERENAEYGEKNLEEAGENSATTAEKLKKKVAEINEQLKEQPHNKPLKKALKQLEKGGLPRMEKYEEQERIKLHSC